jgi:hypothetical protein
MKCHSQKTISLLFLYAYVELGGVGRVVEAVKISFVEKNLPSPELTARSTPMVFVSLNRAVRPCVRMDYSFAALTLGLVVQL